MNDFDFRRVDLNLLTTFDALARFRSATKAGEALGLGQPAVSHALARLRELTQDNLFVRGSNGLKPTALAEGLTGPIRLALAQIEAPIFGPVKFDAKTSAENFRIGMTDFVAAAVLPSFANLLLDEAPSTTISVINCNESNARELLDAREIDLAVGLFRDQEQWLEKEALFEEEHRCVFNRALIPADVPFTLEQFIAAPHLFVTQAGDLRGFVDDILARQSEKRTVLISGPYFLLTGYLLRYLPMISVLPKHYAECCCSASGLAISPLPFEGPISTISTLWRSRNARSSKTRFLRTLLQRSVTVKDVREGSKCNAPA